MSLIAIRRRTLTTLFATAQLALSVALSVAHASASGPGAPAHVEDTSGSACAAAHVDECIACRHLSTSATKGPNPPTLAADPGTAQRTSDRPLSARPYYSHGAQSRAPPC
jgi:hypothetical protein